MAETTNLSGVVIRGAMAPGYEKVLTPEAVAFAVELERKFGAERRRLLARRAEIQHRLDAGWKPDFLPETKAIRDSDWRVAPAPPRGPGAPPRKKRPAHTQKVVQALQFVGHCC